MIEVKAGSLDYIDLRIAKGYDRGLQELVNRWVMFWRKSRGLFSWPFVYSIISILKFFVTRHLDIMTNFICDRYNLNHASGNNGYVILGRDGSGVVTQVGADVFQVQPGDRVWFAIPPCFQVLLQMVVVLAWSKPLKAISISHISPYCYLPAGLPGEHHSSAYWVTQEDAI